MLTKMQFINLLEFFSYKICEFLLFSPCRIIYIILKPKCYKRIERVEVIDLCPGKIFDKEPIVATVGFFDGVHIGHRHLIHQIKEEAKRLGIPSAVITFPVHPRKVLQKDYQPQLLCGFDEKLSQLATTGIDYVIVLPFTPKLSRLTAKDFIRSVLQKQLGVHTLFVGYDHRFGHNREEGFPQYQAYGKEIGMQVIHATELLHDNVLVSSSVIRRLLLEGNIELANTLLTYPYNLSGEIIPGNQLGRTIGFPTANIRSWEPYKVIPHAGVYAVRVRADKDVYGGMLYIGTRPTVNTTNYMNVEVNIFDFEQDLYNRSLTVEFVQFVRQDEKFESLDMLANQIVQDKKDILQILQNH